MRTSDFDFTLPKELIAQSPANPRSSARMLVSSSGIVSDRSVQDLPELLKAGDLLIFNNSKVIKALLSGSVDGRSVRMNLLGTDPNNNDYWHVAGKPMRLFQSGKIIKFADDFSANIIADGVIKFCDLSRSEVFAKLEKYGTTPLPPYIKQSSSHVASDYQTIFANHKKQGAVAAPTAGLHFTEELMDRLKLCNINSAEITLHVGGGTFLPVKSEFIADHKMHSEFFDISSDTMEKIISIKKSGGRVIAVGTTSLRSLESGRMNGYTNIFITPSYKFKIVDGLITNFHLPKSTLFMLVSAFIGKEHAMDLYSHAIRQQYRFYSFGDACLLLPK